MAVKVLNELESFFDLHCLVVSGFNREIYELKESIKLEILGLSNKLRLRNIFFSLFFRILKYINKNKVDVVVSVGNMFSPFLFLFRFFGLMKCKIIFWEHECIRNRDLKSMILRRLSVISADKVVTVSNSTLLDYLNKFKLDKNKILNISNFISADFKKYKCSRNSKSIMSVGCLEKEKGFDMIIKISKIIFKKYNDWKWNIYGEGSQKNFLEEKIKEYNLERNIFLKGNFKNIFEEYNNHSIFVLTSLREGFCLVLLEAKINSIPSVSFNCPVGPNEIIQNNVNGFLVTCYDIREMANKIIFLIENPNIRKAFSDKCNIDLDKFSKENSIKRWIDLLNNI